MTIARARILRILADHATAVRAELSAHECRQLCEMALCAYGKRERDEAAAAGAIQREREMAHAALLAGSSSPEIRERSEAVKRKHEVDAQITDLKRRIGAAKADAHARGRYLPAHQYRALESRLFELQNESQALQLRLGELRRAEADRNRVEYIQEDQAFKRAARRALSEDVFSAILQEAIESLTEDA